MKLNHHSLKIIKHASTREKKGTEIDYVGTDHNIDGNSSSECRNFASRVQSEIIGPKAKQAEMENAISQSRGSSKNEWLLRKHLESLPRKVPE